MRGVLVENQEAMRIRQKRARSRRVQPAIVRRKTHPAKLPGLRTQKLQRLWTIRLDMGKPEDRARFNAMMLDVKRSGQAALKIRIDTGEIHETAVIIKAEAEEA